MSLCSVLSPITSISMFLVLISLLFCVIDCYLYEWAYVHGSKSGNKKSTNTGTTFASSNAPGGRREFGHWMYAGNAFIFGGYGLSNDKAGLLRDLWEFRTSPTLEWRFMGGYSLDKVDERICLSAACGQWGFDTGGRGGMMIYHDTDDTVYSLGGYGRDSGGKYGYMADLWPIWSAAGGISAGSAEPRTALWQVNLRNVNSEYGSPGVFTDSSCSVLCNKVGGRSNGVGIASGGFLYLFGGFGRTATVTDHLNDIFVFTTTQVKYIRGSNTNGAYGGSGYATNKSPGGRSYAAHWPINSDEVFIYGGYGYPQSGAAVGSLADLWKFRLSDFAFDHVSGAKTLGGSGYFDDATLENQYDWSFFARALRGSVLVEVFGKYLLFGGGTANLNPVTNMNTRYDEIWSYDGADWAHARGSTSSNQNPVFGTTDVFAMDNSPSGVYGGMFFRFSDGEVFFFGGYGRDDAGSDKYLQAMWQLRVVTFCFGEEQTDFANVCNGHGSCTGTDTCVCGSNWSGTQCDVPWCFGIPADNPSVCTNLQGTCTDVDVCVCSADWGSTECEISRCYGFLSTDGNVCSQHGACELDHSCTCAAGYTQDECDEWQCYGLNNNDPGVCTNAQGVCADLDNCQCITVNGAAYYSAECQDYDCFGINEANASSCGVHGSCTQPNTCTCTAPYDGVVCDHWYCDSISKDAGGVCSSHGVCSGPDLCSCSAGYNNTWCQEYYCYGIISTGAVCSGNGVCNAPDSCSCAGGYYSAQCQDWDCFTIYKSAPGACNDHGVCQAPDSCLCTAPYDSASCDHFYCNSISKDSVLVCSQHGMCTNPDTCVCSSPFYTNTWCEDWNCYGLFRADAAVCTNQRGSCDAYDTCTCTGGYYSSECEDFDCFGVNYLSPGVCTNANGVCSSPDTCDCPVNVWGGSVCQYPDCFGFLSNNPLVCTNHGVCQNDHSCSCVKQYKGDSCSIPAEICFGVYDTEPNACSTVGNCVSLDTCVCPVGYDGGNCELYSCFGLIETSTFVCSSHGECIGPNVCSCPFYLTGAECELIAVRCFGILMNAANNSVCNGRGKCVKENTCVCDVDFVGAACGMTRRQRDAQTLGVVAGVLGPGVGLLCLILCVAISSLVLFAFCVYRQYYRKLYNASDDLELDGLEKKGGEGDVMTEVSEVGDESKWEKFKNVTRVIGVDLKSAVKQMQEKRREKKLARQGMMLENDPRSKKTDVVRENDIAVRFSFVGLEEFEIDFDEIRLIKKIGAGGSGSTVFYGVWRDKKVALKSFQLDRINFQQAIKEIQREVGILAHVQHINVLRFYGLAVQGCKIGILSEYCEWGDLKGFLSKKKKTPIEIRLMLLVQIARGMEYLHSKGVIHRDLKSENVLLSRSMESKIMDFGLSKVNDDGNLKTQRLGTSWYMAPEVTTSGMYDEKCDVFSYGILFFEVMTGNFNPYGDDMFTKNIEFEVAQNPFYRPKVPKRERHRYPKWAMSYMQELWQALPERRPAFREIALTLIARLRSSSSGIRAQQAPPREDRAFY